ncbi:MULTISPECIES: proton-conducting transporter transmembrane domain-containing protein [Caldilinea]|uniref:proton-conducting transporter transmembrane domain-containing protein n=1 Tax=Caldilinea TaxID=233191 RepID=UPI0002E21482|nr:MULTISPECIES: proton-conducting transporter membrane subunit [Caldilinea]GIV72756.1 MAG: NADH dehydrogenase [Caldilinea sp.]
MSLHPTVITLPVAIPLLLGAVGMFLQFIQLPHRLQVQQTLVGVGVIVNLAVALLLLVFTLDRGPVAYQMGLWMPPFGITVYLDALSAIMLVMVGLLSALIFPFALATIDSERAQLGFFPMMLFLLMGANGAFLTGDLFNLYVFYEVMLMASFVLLTIGGTPSQLNGGIRYVVLNLVGSMMLLLAAGVSYGTLGTLNMAHIAVRMNDAPYLVQAIIAGLLLIAFGAKAAVFPVFFWLPSSYHTPHPVVTALFSGVLTKVGMYSMFRVFPLFFPWLLNNWQPLLMTIAGLTMVVGVLGAFAQPTIRRLLSFHIISQIGYMVMGLAVAMTPNPYGIGFGLALAILFLVHNQIVKTALLLGGGAIELEMGTGKLSELGGLVHLKPLQATVFFIAAFSLAGFPPTSGFIGKLGLLEVTFSSGQWVIAGVSVFVSLLTTMSMIRLWQYIFWGKMHREPLTMRQQEAPNYSWMTVAPVIVLVALSLTLGLAAQPALNVVQTAANQAIDRAAYVKTVGPMLTEQDLRIAPPEWGLTNASPATELAGR